MGFDPNVNWDYHTGALSIKDYNIFRDKVHDLLHAKAVTFTPEGQS